MNRILTASVALAGALGMAGMAQAQTNSTTSPPSSPLVTSPGASQPGMSGAPAGIQNPATMSAPGGTSTYGTSPQANTNQPNTGPQGNQMNQSQMQANQPASPLQIQHAQQQLKSAGLYRGTIDGVMGPETQTALSQFQREQGLPQTAQLDQPTLTRLMNGQTGGMTGPTSQPGMPQKGGTNANAPIPAGNVNGPLGPR